ncbi:MAG: hypothetical protein O3C57_08655, partial [Verrucomicrobia bacterium]|nr:hypothetical protein [Verrucomicrobiota bacterium]
VVPCHIQGAFEAFPADAQFPRPKPVSVRIGSPMTFEKTSNDKTGWSKAARNIERAVSDLAGTGPVSATVNDRKSSHEN